MREISLITGQLHRAIYNLNEEARRAANQKFQAGLEAAPERSLKKVFDQFNESLTAPEVLVRRRAASVIAKLMQTFDRLPTPSQKAAIELVEIGLNDPSPLVREATVESYSQILLSARDEDFKTTPATPLGDETDSESAPQSSAIDVAMVGDEDALNCTNARLSCLHRLLDASVCDVDEVVREAAAVGLGVQKLSTVQQRCVDFYLNNVTHLKYRRACRAIESLAEFPAQRHVFEGELVRLLNDSDRRYRMAALSSCLRLARLDAVSVDVLAGVVRRMFDGDNAIAELAERVARTCYKTLRRTNRPVARLLPACSKIANSTCAESTRDALQKLAASHLFESSQSEFRRLCIDRILWQSKKRKAELLSELDLQQEATTELLERLQTPRSGVNQKKELGWAIARCFERMANAT